MDVEIDMKAVFAVMKIRPEKKKKSLKSCTGFELSTFAIPVQCSSHWANKPTRSWLLCWFLIYPWIDE